uniref:Uncharacterized protein n=1 Tax=viral metagenome TaxID=1070528 RepID=A0A6C0BM80_9ZZZZ
MSTYFRRWLDENLGDLQLTDEEKTSAQGEAALLTHDFTERPSTDYFERYQEPVAEWCRERNRLCHAVDNVMEPNMLPYASFLWQWSAHSGGASHHVSRKVKLSSLPRLQTEMADCWHAVLGTLYVPFPFE